VASFVGGVLASEYRLRGYGVRACVRRGDRRVACQGHWEVIEKTRARTHWACTARLLVWLADPESAETDWDYSAVHCRRGGGSHAARRSRLVHGPRA